MSQQCAYRLAINRQPFEGTLSPRMLLADFPHGDVGLTKVRIFCEHGIRGSALDDSDGCGIKRHLPPEKAMVCPLVPPWLRRERRYACVCTAHEAAPA
jgi:hypothetical protein